MRRIALGLLLLSSWIPTGCSDRAPESLPEELLQVWRTPGPRYRDRYFELREGWLVFGTGRYTSALHSIQKVTSEPATSSTRYTIEYRTRDGAVLPLEILHTPGSPAKLLLGNQPHAWIPEKHARWLEEEEPR